MKEGVKKTADIILWSVLLAGSLAMRLWDLGLRAMSHDESLHAYFSNHLALWGIHNHDPMMHGPLLFQLNAGVFWLFGASDFSARIIFALAGAALVAAPLLFRRHLGRAGALAAGLLLALSPSLLYYSRYMRNDVLFALLVLVWLWALMRFVATKGRGWLWGLAVVMALAFACKETVFIFGAFIGAYLMVLGLLRARRAGESIRHNSACQAAWVMLVMALPFASPLVHMVLGWNPADFVSPQAQLQGKTVIGAMGLLAAALAWLWFGKHKLWGGRPTQLGVLDVLAAACLMWLIDMLLFSNFLRNLPGGVISGFVGSAGYWLGQHNVARGGQPWFYYLMLTALYEFLPLVLGIGGGVALVRGRRKWRAKSKTLGGQPWLPLLAALWAVYAMAAYSIAGEKMPWLMVHIGLPLCLLGGWWLGRVWSWLGRNKAGTAKRALAWCGVALLALAAAHSLRVSLRAVYFQPELAHELLVYAHATPFLKPGLEQALAVAKADPERGEVIYDQESAWPMAWYARLFPKVRLNAHANDDQRVKAAALIYHAPDQKMQDLLAKTHGSEVVTIVWWPIQDYQYLSWDDFKAKLGQASYWSMLGDYFINHQFPGRDLKKWPYRKEVTIFVRRPAAAARVGGPPAGTGGAGASR